MIRAVARITISRGKGRGAALGIVRIRPSAAKQDALRIALWDRLDPLDSDGIISMHLIESDSALSKSIPDDPAARNGAGDWFVLIDGTAVEAISAVFATRFSDAEDLASGALISRGIYRLLWDLVRSELEPPHANS